MLGFTSKDERRFFRLEGKYKGGLSLMKNILYAASEAVPFIKTGGLADVAGALPNCFDKRYFDVRVVLPKYACMKQEWKDKMEYVTHFYMDLGYKNCYVGIMTMEYEGVRF